jgi:hypothetical protein
VSGEEPRHARVQTDQRPHVPVIAEREPDPPVGWCGGVNWAEFVSPAHTAPKLFFFLFLISIFFYNLWFEFPFLYAKI